MRPRSSRPLALVAVVSALAPAVAVAQPAGPTGPPPPTTTAAPGAPSPTPAPPAPAADDIDAQVAAGLLARAKELRDGGDLVAARELASEAAERDPSGPTGAAARTLMDEIDVERRERMPAYDAPPPPPMMAQGFGSGAGAPPEPAATTIDVPAPAPRHRASRALMAGYGGLGGAAIGLGLAGTDERAAAGAIGGAAVGALTGYYVARRGDWTTARAHQVGAGIVWGAGAGALVADVVTGRDGTTDDDVARGAGIGAIGGAVIAGALAADDRLSNDDVALVHSLTAWGAIGGLTTAVAIDPPEGEAYSLNAAIGLGVGYAVGQLAARRTEISSRRLARVNALALLGAGVPLLLWRATADDGVAITGEGGDEHAWGLLATAGLVGGAYLGLRWTRGLDDGPAPAAPGPIALLSRDAAGAWTAGGLAVTPARRGAMLTLLGGDW